MRKRPTRAKHKKYTRYDALYDAHLVSMFGFAAMPLLFGENLSEAAFLAIVLINLPIIWWAVRDSFIKAQSRRIAHR
ncbi:hypothetical protein ACQ4M4_25835 [Leptolyngbya sp. AN02str]|uniref:hypothetical protein n=1 Tax=Leptolyngbya sp. AN02str TaxID=3423363 RepID=UPI003D3240A8